MPLTDFRGADRVATPQAVVDVGRLKANLRRIRDLAPSRVEMHPHVKTHKSFEIAGLQVQAGAAGFTASRPPEAAHFLRGGFGPVTLAYPVVEVEAAASLMRIAAERGTRVRFIADSTFGVDALQRAAAQTGSTVEIFVKVDVGLHRCGVDPAGDAGIDLARAITDAPGLVLAGLLSHAGQAYAANGPEAIRGVARHERELLAGLRERLDAAGFDGLRLSVGSTPTTVCNAGFDDIAEIRPGNYAFFDLTAVRLGIAARSELALAIMSTVISTGAGHAVIDAGSKILSSDLGAHGSSTSSTYGEAYMLGGDDRPFTVMRLSEEHGILDLDGRRLLPGTKMIVLPNHSCPVVNLTGQLCFLEGGEARFSPVDARNGIDRAAA